MDRLIVLKKGVAPVTLDPAKQAGLAATDAMAAIALEDGSIALANTDGVMTDAAGFTAAVIPPLTTRDGMFYFVAGTPEGMPTMGHNINPQSFKWLKTDYVAPVKGSKTFTFATTGVLTNTMPVKHKLSASIAVMDMRQNATNVVKKNVAYYTETFWLDASSNLVDIITSFLQGFIKRANYISEGRFKLNLAANVITLKDLIDNVTSDITLDVTSSSLFAMTKANLTLPVYGVGTSEQVKSLEERVVGSYAVNPVEWGIRGNVPSPKSMVVDGEKYTMFIIESNVPANNPIMQNDGKGMLTRLYIAVPVADATSITKIEAILKAIKTNATLGSKSPIGNI